MTGIPARVRIALDLVGGGLAPDAVLDAALLVSDERPDVLVVLVGPEEVARRVRGRLEVVPAVPIAGGDDPARAVRAQRDAGVRVATRLVRDGTADAAVSTAPAALVAAAAHFTLGLLPGVTRPALAAVVGGGTVLLDVSGAPGGDAETLARAGTAYAGARLGLASPRVAHLVATPTPGGVTGARLTDADVVVTDGFTGAVLASALGHDAGTAVLGVAGVVLAAPADPAAAVRTAAGLVTDRLVDRLRAAFGELVAERRAAAGLGALR